MTRRSPRRFLRALAITLPLGLEPEGGGGGAPPALLPADIRADVEALGAVGVTFRSAEGGEVCAAVALRDASAAPRLGALRWRGGNGPLRSLPVPFERRPDPVAPAGFTLWTGCALTPDAAAGGTLSVLLEEPGARAGEPARRRIDLAAPADGLWRWRAVHAVETHSGLHPPASAAARAEDRHGAAGR